MEPARAFAVAVVATILVVTLASGPLVGAVDLTTAEEDPVIPGSGTLNLTVVSVPDTATLDRNAFGAATYQLTVGDATVDVHHVTGNPIVRYKLKIPAMGYTRVTTTFLDADDVGRLTIAFESTALAPAQVDRDRYAGELQLATFDDGGTTTHVERNVTVEVRG